MHHGLSHGQEVVEEDTVPESCRFSAKLTISEDPTFIPESTLMQMPEEQARAYRDALGGNKLGGTPGFLQGDELPIPEPWYLLLQLDSAQVPFWSISETQALVMHLSIRLVLKGGFFGNVA